MGLSGPPAANPDRPGPVPVPVASFPAMSCGPAARPRVRIRSGCRGRAVIGSTSSKLLPAPGVLRTRTSPPWPWAIARTSASPSPVRGGRLGPEPVRNRSKMWPSSAGRCPPRSPQRSGGRTEPRTRRTESLITSPEPVCWIAFSSSASRARPRRSRSALTVTASSLPSCQRRRAVGRQRRRTSMTKPSSATGSGRRKSGFSRRRDQQQLLVEALEPGQLADHDVDVLLLAWSVSCRPAARRGRGRS